MVRHTAETYREAALEHLKVAQTLHHDLAEYGAAHYWSGLAVECMLRAYMMRVDRRFEARHDLVLLAKASGFQDQFGPNGTSQMVAALADVSVRWANDHRYRSSRLVRLWLRQRGIDERVVGDKLKYSSGRIVAAAAHIVQTGARQWPSMTK